MRTEKARPQSRTTAHNYKYSAAQPCVLETLSPGLNGASEQDVLFNMGFFILYLPDTIILPKVYPA